MFNFFFFHGNISHVTLECLNTRSICSLNIDKFLNLEFLCYRVQALCLPHGRPMTLRDKVLRQRKQLYSESSWLRWWRVKVSKRPCYWCLDARFFYRSGMVGGGEGLRKQSKKAIKFAHMSYNVKLLAVDVLISSFWNRNPSSCLQSQRMASMNSKTLTVASE